MIAVRIADNLARIRDRIAASATRCGREPDEVTLVAVTKYVGIEEARALVEAGCYDLGESRPQELWNKAQALGHPTARWHMIGHLQRNKVRRTLGCISKLHSGDSWRLLRAVNGEAAAVDLRLPVLLEVNISGDKSKYGFQPDEMSDVVGRASQLENLDVRGLMAMSALEGGGAGARKEFRGLRDLRDRLLESCPAEVTLTSYQWNEPRFRGWNRGGRDYSASGISFVRRYDLIGRTRTPATEAGSGYQTRIQLFG